MPAKLPEVGDLFLGRYQIEALLADGGFARVYLALQTDLDRPVALKILRPQKLGDAETPEDTSRHNNFAKRFEREAKVISKLRDPRTVVMHDYGRTENDHLYMVLEFVHGLTASQLVKAAGAVASHRVASILEQVLRSLREAHSMGGLHRDIKPQNIMVFDHMGDVDQVKVLDFGIAKPLTVVGGSSRTEDTELTGADGMLVGTPRYMSPEQIRGDELTPASDIYSLGLVAYELLMGKKAVEEPTTVRIISRHLSARPIELPLDATVPEGLRAIVDRMLQKDVDDRYRTTQDVLDALLSWQDPPLIELEVDFEIAEERAGSKRGFAVVTAIVVALLAVGAFAMAQDTASEAVPEPVVEPTARPEETVAVVAEVEPRDVPSAEVEVEPAAARPEPAVEPEAPTAEPDPVPAPEPVRKKKRRKKRAKKNAPKPSFLPVE